MSERTVKISLLDQCPDNCAAMEIISDKYYAEDEVVWIKHSCKNMVFCAMVFESMENLPRELIKCDDCRFYQRHITKESENKCTKLQVKTKQNDYCSFSEPIIRI